MSRTDAHDPYWVKAQWWEREMMESATKVDLGDLADIAIMAGATEGIDWEARAKAAEAKAETFETKYRGLRRKIVEVGSREARRGSWCEEFDNTLALIDPLLKRIAPPRQDYRVTVEMSFTLRDQTEQPSQEEMLRLAHAWASRWQECIYARTYGGNGIALSMLPTCKQINPVADASKVYNPELDEDDYKILGVNPPAPVNTDDDDDDDDDY